METASNAVQPNKTTLMAQFSGHPPQLNGQSIYKLQSRQTCLLFDTPRNNSLWADSCHCKLVPHPMGFLRCCNNCHRIFPAFHFRILGLVTKCLTSRNDTLESILRTSFTGCDFFTSMPQFIIHLHVVIIGALPILFT
jgi:hypothetical protein